MGQYFTIVNLSKKQYFHGSIFDEGTKWAVLGSLQGFALGQLLAYSLPSHHYPTKWSKLNQIGIWAGCWAGDKIVFLGDETQENDLVQEIDSQCLFLTDWMLYECENIGAKVIAWLASNELFQELLLQQLQNNPHYLATLGYITYQHSLITTDLKLFLEKVDANWEAICQEIWSDKKHSFVMPKI